MEQDNRPVINVKDVLAFLEDGKTREQIREHYGLSKRDLTLLFKHEELKGKKTRIAPGFVFAQESNIMAQEDAPTNEEVSNRDYETSATTVQSDDVQQSEDAGNNDTSAGEESAQWAN